MSGADNPFIRLIRQGRIKSLQQLRNTYRTLVMKTHPDTVGSNRLIDRYLSFGSYYEEAKSALENPDAFLTRTPGAVAPSHRLAYYQTLHKLERIDKPYSFHRSQNLKVIHELKAGAYSHFVTWKGEYRGLYSDSDRDYDRLKAEKPSGPYMKHALAVNVSPVFHNIVNYHLTGMLFYKTQLKQNLMAVLQRLTDHECHALREFIELLIHDMDNGPAVFGESKNESTRKLPEL